MPVQFAGKLLSAAELSVIPQSLVVKDGVEFAATRSGNTPQLAILAPARSPYLEQFEGAVTDHGDSKLLLGPANANQIVAVLNALKAALQNGKLSKARVDEAATRIITLKMVYHLIPDEQPDFEQKAS